jgi:hypothetical protein
MRHFPDLIKIASGRHTDARFERSPVQNYHSSIDIEDEAAIPAVVPSC